MMVQRTDCAEEFEVEEDEAVMESPPTIYWVLWAKIKEYCDGNTSDGKKHIKNCGDGPLKTKASGEWALVIKIGSCTTQVLKSLREIDSVSKADSLEAWYKFLHMMNHAQGMNAGQRMHAVFIFDSGSPFHCTGDITLFSPDYTEAPPDCYIYGASGKGMRVLGVGSIRNEMFQVQDVLYVPDLNQPNVNKTIISVSKLTKLGYSVFFSFDGTSCSVIDNRKRTWTWQHEIVGEAHMERGHYMLDYLRIPLDRAPVATSPERQGLVKSLWNAAFSGWSTITQRLSQRANAQRPPV